MTEEIAHPLVPHGAVPKSIPQHLQGEVWDFRNEPDGRISFQHPKEGIIWIGMLKKTRTRVSNSTLLVVNTMFFLVTLLYQT